MSAKKSRLDRRLVKDGLAQSRGRAQAMIMSGKVLVNRQPVDKPGAQISDDDPVVLKGEDIPYVSRGGFKLAAALAEFDIRPSGLICLDVGASTGGFTDCLLQNGAEHVFAVDVGYGQLAWPLRQDPRVTAIERTNIRHMDADRLPRTVDLVTVDVSFISLKIVIPAVMKFMKSEARIISLIKPQFEVGKGQVGKGGVVKDAGLHDTVIRSLSAFFSDTGLAVGPVVPSPVLGPKGNREFLILLRKS